MQQYNVPIMVAPNGARLTKTDHPHIPVTVDQTIHCAHECKLVGAHALHAHVRDKQQKHLLDADAYRSLLNKASATLGNDFPVQITTEAFGIYSTDEQIALVKELKPQFASIAMREIIRTDDVAQARDFYHWCLTEHIGVQHILYGQDDLEQFNKYREREIIPALQDSVLLVIGRYTDSNVADTEESQTVINVLATSSMKWMICAFGATETDCLQQAATAGGGVRVGFENSTQHSNGEIASDNAERVNAVSQAIGNNNAEPVIDLDRLHALLGAR